MSGAAVFLALCLTLPAAADLQHTGPNQASALRVWSRMPPRVQKLNVVSIEAKRGTPQWKWVGRDYYGRADASRNLIVFRDYSPGHFAHELGHLLWPLMTREQAAEIQAEFADHPGRAPQDYGRRNVWEFFSDVFRGVFAPGSFQDWGARGHFRELFERWGWGPVP